MSTYIITGFNDEGKFKIVNDVLYIVDTSNTYKGHLINSTPFDEIMLEEYKQEEYKYMYENSNTNKETILFESKNNIKKVNIAYKTLDIVEPMKTSLKFKKNTKVHNWKKHCKQIKKKQQQKIKSKMIKKKQMYKFDLNHNYSNYDISWYHVYKDKINSNIEFHCCDSCDDCDNYSNLTFLDDDYRHLFEYDSDDNDNFVLQWHNGWG